MRLLKLCFLSAGLLAFAGLPASAVDFELDDVEASVDASTNLGLDADWLVNGEYILTQSFFLGPVGEIESQLAGIADTNTIVDDRDDTATIALVTDSSIAVISMMLRGSIFDPRQSDLAETIEVFNVGEQTIRFEQQVIFNTNLFDEEGASGGIVNGNTVGLDTDHLSFEEVVTPGWDRIIFYDTEEDGQFGFQLSWDVDPGETLLISKDKRIRVLPEPEAHALMGFGLLGLAWAGRRRRTG